MAPPTLVCPRCRHLDPASGQLHVHALTRDHDDRIAVAGELDGTAALVCTSAHCRARYPVFDGVPVVFAAPNALTTDTNPPLDLLAWPLATRQALIERCGHDNPLVETLRRLARCCTSGFGDWMPGTDLEVAPHAVSLTRWLDGLEPEAAPDRRWRAVLGSAMGREAWANPERPTVLVDAWLPALLAARHLQREGHLEVLVPAEPGRWRPDTVEVPDAGGATGPRAMVCCDVLDPPFEAEVFGELVLSNVVDSVVDPWVLLGQANALRAHDARLTVSSPMSWRASVTPPQRWLSALPGANGESERGLLTALADLAPELRSLARTEIVWWQHNSDVESVVYRNVVHCFGCDDVAA